MQNCNTLSGKPEANCEVLHPDKHDHVEQSSPNDRETKRVVELTDWEKSRVGKTTV